MSFESAIARITRVMNAVAHGPNKAAADWIEQDFKPLAKQIVPVATGELRDSIDGEVTATGPRVYADAPHARYVEEGTSKAKAQPFMGPAIDQTRGKLRERVRAEIRKGFQ